MSDIPTTVGETAPNDADLAVTEFLDHDDYSVKGFA